ncbi:hypothetical protein EZ313_09080 [Ramlibacter henchirensis]|uniref:Serine/threonine protein kinase n=1 Tax=Ramlibacter henchirensis TaxID=204072 RepID=A0A4Z0C529_9BURK|nr:hypothetical protein [Ramlibacter henchirensis]TFZ06756.1 hypothetical protein EZ313_09080 [Ramlibacter henchirensis]
MNKAKTTVSLLLAGLMAGGAWAQTASATSDVPVKAGEASTQTRGQPNMATSNAPGAAAPVTSASGAPVQSATSSQGATSTHVMGAGREIPHHSSTVTSNVPTKAGEASTMTNGVPNMATHNANPDGSRVITPPVLEVQRVPQQAGEASTMIGGRPNANPEDPAYRR